MTQTTYILPAVGDWPAGDSKTLELTLRDESGTAIAGVAASDIEWYLVDDRGDDRSAAVIDETDAAVSVTAPGPDGRIDIDIDQGTGIDAGLYWQYIVHDPAGSRQTWLGEVYIAP